MPSPRNQNKGRFLVFPKNRALCSTIIVRWKKTLMPSATQGFFYNRAISASEKSKAIFILMAHRSSKYLRNCVHRKNHSKPNEPSTGQLFYFATRLYPRATSPPQGLSGRWNHR